MMKKYEYKISSNEKTKGRYAYYSSKDYDKLKRRKQINKAISYVYSYWNSQLPF